jgi:hypothetical protein
LNGDAEDVATTADHHESSLTPLERALIEHVENGEILDLAPGQPINDATMQAWDKTRTISATVIRDVVRGRHVTDPDPHGLRLRGARICGRLDLENIASTIAIELTECLLDQGLNARDATLPYLDLSGCRLSHPTEPPLDAAHLTASNLILNGTTSNGGSLRGTVNVRGAHLGRLECEGARLSNDSGPALNAERLRVDEGVYLRHGFEATGSGKLGAVRLLGAHIGGQLSCYGARLSNDSGPALNADGLKVSQDVYLRSGFEAIGSSDAGAVRLLGAQISGQLDCSGARLSNDSGPALNADRLKVDQNVILNDGFVGVGAGEDVVLCLRDAVIGGSLGFQPNQLEHLTKPHALLNVDGLAYTGLPNGIKPDEWLALLRDGTLEYAAQPYQHLAAAHRAAGHDREARRVLIAQRRDQIKRRALTGRATRTWVRLTGLFLGYGYRPWRALIALTLVLAAAVLAAIILGGSYGALAQIRNPPPVTPVPCTWVERIGVGLDLGTPLITTNTRTRCDTTNTTPGHILTIAGWTLRLLAWAFATLFIAGFTTAVRKT